MKKNINFALIGCGRIAKKHAELLGKSQILNATLAAVADIKMSRAEILGKAYNVPYFSDMHDLMQSVNVDVIVILTENGNHSKHLIELAKYKKHFIVEKPLALKVDDADKMIASCESNGCKLFVVKQNRFNLPIRKLFEVLESGRFGKLILGTVRVRWCRPQDYYDQDAWRGTWALDGGILANQAIHHIDMLLAIFGGVHSVYANSSRSLVDIEIEDTAIVNLKFESGALGIIEATMAMRPYDVEGSISVLGEGGFVEIGGIALNKISKWHFNQSTSEDGIMQEKYSSNPANIYGFGHKSFYENIVNSILYGEEKLVTTEDARKAVCLINAIYHSIETGKEVFLQDLPKFSKY